LAAMALLPPLTVLSARASRAESASPVAVAPTTPGLLAPVAAIEGPSTGPAWPAVQVRDRIANALPGIVGLWCAGVLILSVRYLGGWRLVQRMDRSARPLLDGEVAASLGRLLRRMRVSRPV